MKQYRVKGDPRIQETVRIVSENAQGFEVVITKIRGSDTREYRDFISRPLFESCMRTQYLVEDPGEGGGLSA